MAGGYTTAYAVGRADDLATVAASSNGTTITSGAASTYGSWAQLIASTAEDYDGLHIVVNLASEAAGAGAIDIAVAASGNEANGTIIQGVTAIGSWSNGFAFDIPRSIPAGSRVAARFISVNASDTLQIQAIGLCGGYGRPGFAGIFDTYGWSGTGTPNGIAVDCGAIANTKGAYVQFTASATHDLSGFFLSYDLQNTPGGASSGATPVLLDVAIGAAGSEKVVLPNLLITRLLYNGGGEITPSNSGLFYIPISAGQRIAIRGQCAVNTTPDRVIGISFHGLRA